MPVTTTAAAYKVFDRNQTGVRVQHFTETGAELEQKESTNFSE